MRREKREHPEAHDELREAACWYEDHNAGLGEDFLNAINESIQRIRDWPYLAPTFPGWTDEPTVRSMAVPVFPFRVLYYLTSTSFVVLAYAHERRKPMYWLYRIDYS